MSWRCCGWCYQILGAVARGCVGVLVGLFAALVLLRVVQLVSAMVVAVGLLVVFVLPRCVWF